MTIREVKPRRIFPFGAPLSHAESHDQQATFALVSSLAALLLAITLLIDLVVITENELSTRTSLFMTLGFLLLALPWVVIPLFVKNRFPYAAGFTGLVLAILAAVYYIGFSRDPIGIMTGLQMLPVLALYIGWFWGQLWSRLVFAASVVLLVVVVAMNPDVGEDMLISTSSCVLGLLTMTFSYAVGAYLRWQLHRKANTDELTGVLNRGGALGRLQIEMNRSERFGEALSIAVIDFDRFKQLNDTKGHAFGDQVLRETVRYWVTQLRRYDIVGRTGGDEFVIIFPRTSSAEAEKILSRLRIESPHAWTWGLAQFRPEETLEHMFARADARLYEWKHRRDGLQQAVEDTTGRVRALRAERSRGLARLLSAFSAHHSEFSLISAAAALVTFAAMTTAVLLTDFSGGVFVREALMLSALVVSGVAAGLPLMLGSAYPKWLGLFFAAVGLLYGAAIMLVVENFAYGLTVFLFATLMTIYLGAFSGSVTSRMIILTGLTAVSASAVFRFFPDAPTQQQLIVSSTVAYSYLVCWFLFEVGSYLYWSSSTRIYHDSLTGALNRFGLREYGEAELQRALRAGSALSVAVVDFVGFKQVNDREGHAAGDAVLRKTVMHFNENLETYDLIIRVGGDEFVLMLPHLTCREAEQRLAELRRETPHPWVAGIAEVVYGDDLDAVLARADADLYRRRGVILDSD